MQISSRSWHAYGKIGVGQQATQDNAHRPAHSPACRCELITQPVSQESGSTQHKYRCQPAGKAGVALRYRRGRGRCCSGCECHFCWRGRKFRDGSGCDYRHTGPLAGDIQLQDKRGICLITTGTDREQAGPVDIERRSCNTLGCCRVDLLDNSTGSIY